MSTIHIHIGQCGNQLSIPLWKNFMKYNEDKQDRMFTSMDGKHRGIHIDSESKVISSLPKNFKLRDSNVIVGKRGRGTNFALGYHGIHSQGDDHLLDDTLEAIRKEIERCDMYAGVVVHHSISGGTGSGLGAHIIELLRDLFPCGHIMSCAVAPCASGESPLQNYNALLALHHLNMFADAIIYLQNDFYISYLERKHQASENKSDQVSFKNINEAMANALCGSLLPTNSLATQSGRSTGQEPWELMRSIAPMPSSKFITLAQCLSAKLSWEGMVSRVLRNFPRYSSCGSSNSCLAATAIGRGDKDNLFVPVMHNCMAKLRKSISCVQWNPYPFDFWTAKDNYISQKNSCSLTLAVNSSCVKEHLQRVLSQSLLKLECGAYVHWYHRHGIGQDLFSESIQSLQSIIDNYTDMTKD